MTTNPSNVAPLSKKARSKNEQAPSPATSRVPAVPSGAQGATLTFFLNSKGAPVADLYLGTRRLLATTHPATIVAALFAMDINELTVITLLGNQTAKLDFIDIGGLFIPLPAVKVRMQLNPRLFQFRHLSPDESFLPLLEGLDLFAQEDWQGRHQTPVADPRPQGLEEDAAPSQWLGLLSAVRLRGAYEP